MILWIDSSGGIEAVTSEMLFKYLKENKIDPKVEAAVEKLFSGKLETLEERNTSLSRSIAFK